MSKVVYVVFSGYYSNLEAIFSTRKKAEKFISSLDYPATVADVELDVKRLK